MPEISYQRSLPVRYDVDVFVAGGGPAGCAAAVAAARQGARVFLAEGQGCLGGLGTAGMVPAFMTFGDGVHFLAAGIGEEILNRMWKLGRYEETGFAGSYSIRVEALKRVYDDMLEEAGVEFVLNTQINDIVMDGASISCCVLAGKSGMYAVRAKTYIDCTGDGDLCAWAGVPFKQGDDEGNVMASTLCSLWANIDWARKTVREDALVEKAYGDGVFEKLDRHLPGVWALSHDMGGGNIGHLYNVDGTDERTMTRALVDGRRLYEQYERFYREYVPGFEEAEMVATANMMGVRESRRIVGEYELCLNDFVTRAVFDDEIGRYCYNVDIHASNNSRASHDQFTKDHEGFRYKDGENYGVPYRILVPKKADNLLTAGRCVSTDRYMQSSIRVMPGCYITGQAAGVAAAQCAERNIPPRAADVRDIQKRLKKMGMYLPNFKD